MRGPGAVPGLFALESAMDELAIKLNMDPVEFRLKNDTLDRRGEEQAVFFASLQGVSAGRSGEVRLVEAFLLPLVRCAGAI